MLAATETPTRRNISFGHVEVIEVCRLSAQFSLDVLDSDSSSEQQQPQRRRRYQCSMDEYERIVCKQSSPCHNQRRRKVTPAHKRMDRMMHSKVPINGTADEALKCPRRRGSYEAECGKYCRMTAVLQAPPSCTDVSAMKIPQRRISLINNYNNNSNSSHLLLTTKDDLEIVTRRRTSSTTTTFFGAVSSAPLKIPQRRASVEQCIVVSRQA